MSRKPLTADDLWAIPRVGTPVPSPDGARFVVPVTTYTMERNAGLTRLWVAPNDATRAGDGSRHDAAVALTGATISATSPAWSPDGERVAFTRKPGDGASTHGDQTQLHVIAADGGEAVCHTDFPLGVDEPRWLPDGHRIVFLATVDLDAPDASGTAEKIAEDERNPGPEVRVTEDGWYRDWDEWLTDRRRRHVFVIDLDDGALLNLTPKLAGRFDAMDLGGGFDVAPDGKEIAIAVTRAHPGNRVDRGIFVVPIPARLDRPGRHAAPRDITPEGWFNASGPRYAPDGAYLLCAARADMLSWSAPARLMLLEPRSRRATPIAENWDQDPSEWTFTPRGDRIVCVAPTKGRTTLFSLSVKSALRRPATEPKSIAVGDTWSGVRVSGRRLYLNECTLRRPGEVVSLELDGSDVRRHTAFTAPSLALFDLGRVEERTIRGADGDAVQMILVHPPAGKGDAKGAKRRRSLVHLVHGGPHSAFGHTWHWRWNAHVFAGAGHLVAMVNFHGSSGWGHAFTESIVGTWGDKPYEDVMAATDWLVERAYVDPKRMAVTGGSYGGYLVSWIASQTDRFACIVNHAGVCDLQTQFACDAAQGWSIQAGGDMWSDREGLDRYNPLRHADGFRSPMLILHGERDYRVPADQARQIYAVYKARRKPARLVIYPNENHWILSPRNSVHWYGEVLGWIDRWFRRGRGRTRSRS